MTGDGTACLEEGARPSAPSLAGCPYRDVTGPARPQGPESPMPRTGKTGLCSCFCGLAKTPGRSAEGMPQMLELSGAAHRDLKQCGSSAPSPTMWDKQVLAFLEEKGHPKSG